MRTLSKATARSRPSKVFCSVGHLLAIMVAAAPLFAGPTATRGASDGLGSDENPADVIWNARAAEHLLNRAGFGARPLEIESAVRQGQEKTVQLLLEGLPDRVDPFFAQQLSSRDGGMEEERAEAEAMGIEGPEFKREFADRIRELRELDRVQHVDFLNWWVERMLEGRNPLRERMVLFWHGFFVSGMREVKSSYEMIRQNEFFRANATGNYADLLYGIARDAAMLEYLDNDSNRKGQPNENFARELMELFSLGEGHYTEKDIQEAARAFTGWTDKRGDFRFDWRRHDFGYKNVLGVSGRLDGDDVIEILLNQDACAQHVAGKLIAYFEGRAAEGERLTEYADFLRANEYDLRSFLERLFLDPSFYRPEVRGTRVSSPIDYLVGSARRIGVEPPARAIVVGAGLLGEKLFEPPNVKGWPGGMAWITTSSLMQRGNLVGSFLGTVDYQDVFGGVTRPNGEADSMLDPMSDSMSDSMGSDMQDSMDPMEFEVVVQEGDSDSAEGGGEDREGERNERLMNKEDKRAFDAQKLIKRAEWEPRINFLSRLRRSRSMRDAEIAEFMLEELLAVEPTEQVRSEALALLKSARSEFDLADGELIEAGPKAERVLRELAHLILSLPEGQLH